MARSTCYDATPVEFGNTALVKTMAAICDEFEAYGWRRVGAALRQRGMVLNHKKVRRLMREHDLQPRRRRRHVATTDSDHDTTRSSVTWRRTLCPTGRTSSGWPT
jgi:hypothetical protein